MGKHSSRRPHRPRRRRPWITVAVVAAVALGLGGAYWWSSRMAERAGGTPSLVLDREVIDFGDVAFETPVNAVFTLRNAGDGVLRLVEAPRVHVVAGC